MAEGARGPPIIQVLHSVEWNSQVVFLAAIQILQAQLIFDGDDNASLGREKLTYRMKVVLKGILMAGEQCRIFENSDQEYPIKPLLGSKAKRIVDNDANIREVAAALGGDASAAQTAFDGGYLGAHLAEIACDGAAAATEFENSIAGTNSQRPHQAMAGPAQMIFRGPIGDGLKEFRGEGAAVRGVGNQGKKPVFDLFAVGIGEILPTGVAKEVRLFIPQVVHQHVSATKASDRSSLAIAMVQAHPTRGLATGEGAGAHKPETIPLACQYCNNAMGIVTVPSPNATTTGRVPFLSVVLPVCHSPMWQMSLTSDHRRREVLAIEDSRSSHCLLYTSDAADEE